MRQLFVVLHEDAYTPTYFNQVGAWTPRLFVAAFHLQTSTWNECIVERLSASHAFSHLIYRHCSVSFLPRDSICRACYILSPVRLSVCLSVCRTSGSVKNGWS